MCNNDLTLKSEYAHLNELNIVKYMFYIEFNNHDWTQIILSRVHHKMFQLGDAQVAIDYDLIHKVTSLSNEGCNIINDKNVMKTIETKLFTKFDGRKMKVDSIEDKGVKFLSKILG